MRKFLIKIILISSICSILIMVYVQIATKCETKYLGPTTADQIIMSFSNSIKDNYNCYFLGNSRIYRGINPEIFPDVKAYNFAHDNDSYNQMYYKLLYLIQNGARIDYLIIGTDYFQFSFLADSRNYIYSDLFPKEYSSDYKNHSWIKNFELYCTTEWKNKQNVFLYCIKYILKKPAPKNISYQKPNGQYIEYGMANPDATIKRNYKVLDIQYDYFKKIIKICEDEDIEMFIVMPPLWSGETDSHTDKERDEFNNMIISTIADTRYKDNYINYSEENGLSPYTDFIDITHLHPSAADRFSEYINQRIFKRTTE